MQDQEVIQDSQHSLSKHRLCLTSQVAFYGRVTIMASQSLLFFDQTSPSLSQHLLYPVLSAPTVLLVLC